MFMVLSSWQSHCESSPGSFDECRTAPSGRRPSDQAKRLRLMWVSLYRLPESTPTIAIYYYYSARKLILYSFYRPTEGRRLCRPGWLVTYRDGLPASRRSPILVLTGSDVAQLRWSQPTRYHYTPNRERDTVRLWQMLKCPIFNWFSGWWRTKKRKWQIWKLQSSRKTAARGRCSKRRKKKCYE